MAEWMALKCPLGMHLTNAIGIMLSQWLMICWMFGSLVKF
jgi:hypothetical protein